jgi:GNAT superfamily N-acetyltransferase
MSKDEIREIAEIVGTDKAYAHFVRRINKEFDLSDEDRNSNVYVLFQEKDNERVGFVVIGHSPVKMRVWEKTFKEEGWVDDDFEMSDPCYELMYMYVKPEVRGQGHANKLFKKTIDFAKDKNVNAIYSYVSDQTDTALKFYKKMNANVLQDFSDEEVSTAFLEWKL